MASPEQSSSFGWTENPNILEQYGCLDAKNDTSVYNGADVEILQRL